MDQLRCCRPFLLEVIKRLKPANILGLGKYALKALTNTNNQNITKARGKNMEVPGL
jgi:uracil-DNA glycosylase